MSRIEVDPWEEARAVVKPDHMLIRVICTMKNVQAFVEIPRDRTVGHLVDTLDNGTMFDRDDYTVAQRKEIVRGADAVYSPEYADSPA